MAIQMRNRLLELIQAKEGRERRIIPQAVMARELGISVNTLKAWVKQDVKRYDTELVSQICDYFGLKDVNELFVFEETETA